MKRQDVRPGKIIYLVGSVCMSISTFTVERVCEEEILQGTSTFAHGKSVDNTGYLFEEDMFSLRDYNIIPNKYNQHRAFFTFQAAKRYQNKLNGGHK